MMHIPRYRRIKINSFNNIMTQSQSSGFIFENEAREKLFGLPSELNNTRPGFDIAAKDNIYNTGNVSIKSVKSGGNLCFSSIQRFRREIYNDDSDTKGLVIKYKQNGDYKEVINIFELDLTAARDYLFSTLPADQIDEYCDLVKKIPAGKPSADCKLSYKTQKNALKKMYPCAININPKVDSKTQRRVQCSVTRFEEKLRDYIIYESMRDTGKPNLYKGKEISLKIYSPQRKGNKSNTE